MHSTRSNKQSRAILAVALLALSFAASVFVPSNVTASEQQQFVHTTTATLGNVTHVDKPAFPIFFNASQIAIGRNWSITQQLTANHTYHIFLYGMWTNGSAPKTDYDIYVFNPAGALESEHTEAAGLPEQIKSKTNETYFIPTMTGNYTFVIANDPRESRNAQPATFMAIENIECNRWQSASISGKKPDGTTALNTNMAYEFITDSSQIEIWIKIPDTLDMYEAKLLQMSGAQSSQVSGVPLPWELGLYGNVSGQVGGYSLDSDNYTGVSRASCEYKGQDMFLNYSSTAKKAVAYYLVLSGEEGEGQVDFLVKTQFTNATLTPTKIIAQVSPLNSTAVTYASNASTLERAELTYSTDHWNTTQTINMTITNATCTASIPKQAAGSLVEYRVSAYDTLKNSMQADGNFTVKNLSTLNITAEHDTIRIGENLTIAGRLSGANVSAPVTLLFLNSDTTDQITTSTSANGTFSVQLKPNATGPWVAYAKFAGNNLTYGCISQQLPFTVADQPLYVKNGAVIGGAFLGIIGAIAVVSFIRKRRQ